MSRRRHGEPGPEVMLPITPMLDMSFQLLFFFMATFNPTDPEGAQVLAMAREKKIEKKDTSPMAQDPKKVKPDVVPDNKKEKKKDEDLELDTDLRLFIDVNGGGNQPILLKDGAVDVKKADTLQDADLIKALKSKLEERKLRAREDARKNGAAEGSADFEKAVDAEFAKQKVRIQTTVDVPWGEVFQAMNLCTHLGFKTVALTTPKDYVPKIPVQQ